MVQHISTGALAPFLVVMMCVFSPTKARVGSPARKVASNEGGGSPTGSHAHHADLPDVLSKAVDMMNSGVLQFLKEETPASLPARDRNHPTRTPEDFLRVAKSQERALKLLRQMSNDFVSIHGVAQKMKNETHICSHLQPSDDHVKDLTAETTHLKDSVNFLLKKAEICQDKLKLAEQTASSWEQRGRNCETKINSQVQATVAEDAKQNADIQQEIETLRRENADLRQRNDELERRNAALEGGTGQQQGALNGEVKDLRKKVQGLEEDKQAMIHTMQQFMRTNETETLTKSLQKEIETMKRQHLQMDMRYQQKIAKLQKRLQDATDKSKDMKEVTKEVQEDNVNKDQTIDQLKVQLNQFQQVQTEAALDKKQLLTTLQGVLRENTAFQNSLKDVQDKLKQSEDVRKRDCPASQTQTVVPRAQKRTNKVEPQTPQQQVAEAQNMDSGDDIATMGEALPINKYITTVREQDIENGAGVAQDVAQDDSSLDVEQPMPRKAQATAQESMATSMQNEEDLPPSLKLNAAHSAPVRSALSRWLGVNGAAEAAAARLPAQPKSQASSIDNSDPAQSTSLLAQAQHSVDEAGADDE